MAVAVLSEAVPKRTDRARYHLHPSRPEGHCLEMTLSRSSGADTVDRRRSLTARFRARMLRRDADHRACRCVTTVARFSSIPATMRKLRMTMIEAWKPADSAEWVVRAQWSSGWSGSWWSDVVGGQSPRVIRVVRVLVVGRRGWSEQGDRSSSNVCRSSTCH